MASGRVGFQALPPFSDLGWGGEGRGVAPKTHCNLQVTGYRL